MDLAPLKATHDKSDMFSRIGEFTTVFQTAFDMGLSAKLPAPFSSATSVLGLGMGGSGMGYKLLQSLAKKYGTIPISILSDYDLPPYLNPTTAVCATSFSGSTEETLEATRQAIEKSLPIVCITTGGKLVDVAKKHLLPLVQFDYPVPPRVGLPYTFGIALGIFVQAGFLKLSPDEVKTALAECAKLASAWANFEDSNNLAVQIADRLQNKMVYAIGGGISEATAIRWKGQLNENSKVIAFAEAMPEMCHNMVLGYKHPESIRRNSAIIFLSSPHDHAKNLKRIDILTPMFAGDGVEVIRPDFGQLSALGTMLAQIALGDYVSYYLALLNGEDPTEQNRISDLKKQLENI